MSTTIDQKVVEMRFENKQFESNVAATMSTLDKLKQRLNFTGATKGLADIDSASKRVDMSTLGTAVDTIQAKFSALQVMGITALSNIANQAVNTGKRMISALTIDPIKTGFSEYETKINSIQTIMSNTASKGKTMSDVTKVLNELNTYADKTIYNFAEMTRNIGTFTAAGVGLEESASAIQGIANLAAASGSTSQQASTAMYQLSQALASGTVKLMDWNSVVNAGMGGELFQNALKDTARVHGVAVDDIIKKEGSFRESLKNGWLTADILTETLSKMTKSGAAEYLAKLTGVEQKQIEAAQKLVATNKNGKASYEELAEKLAKTGKITKDKAIDILKLADNAEDAATKVKTFTQLWDTLKESAQSGWAQSWEIVVGNFEEAKELLTEISDTIGGLLGKSADSRNKILQGWKDLGGRTVLVDSLRNTFEAFVSVVKPIAHAFEDVFPPVTAKRIYDITVNLKKFTEGLKLSSETSDKLQRIFKGLFSIFDIVKKAITSVTKALFGLSQSEGIGSLADFVLDTLASLGDFFTSINDNFDSKGLTGAFTTLGSGISKVLKSITGGLKGLGSLLSSVGGWIVKVAKSIGSAIGSAFDWLSENISTGDIFAGLAGGGIFMAANKIVGVFDKISGIIDTLFGEKGAAKMTTWGEDFKEMLGSVKDALNSFTTGINVASLVGISVSIMLLSSALTKLAEINIGDSAKALLSMGVLFGILTWSFKAITKTINLFPVKGIIKAGISLVLMAKSMDILADAITKIAKLPFSGLLKGLIGVGFGLLILTQGAKAISKANVSPTTSVSLLAMAKSCEILADALVKFGDMSWNEIGRGLTAMGGALTELVIAVSVLNKFGGFKSLIGAGSIWIVVQSLDELSENLERFGKMPWSEIRVGLTAMGGALAELGTVVGVLGKLTGFSGVLGAGAIWVGVQALDELSENLKKFGEMNWSEVRVGLTAMGGALAELGVVFGALGKLTGFSGLLGAGTILLGVQSLDEISECLSKLGSMSWSEVRVGLTAMGGALLEVGVITGALGYLTGFAGILGGAAIWVAVQGLGDLADAFMKFGSMTWEEVRVGLVAMGGALLEVGTISGALGYLAGFAGLLGGAAIWTAVQGLGDLADAFQKFGSMSWEDVRVGLVAMGGALTEIAVGGIFNTFSGMGASSIAKVAEPLGKLADSVKKWNDVEVPFGLGVQLGILANGIMAFTFGGLGASALAESAGPLGTLADSVKKWTGVTIPEGFAKNLDALADGIEKFTFAGIGSNALATAAPAVGQLADGVKKWANLTIPDNITDQLTSLAEGVKSFTWAFMGGWSISAVAGPLGELAADVSKWKNVSIPTNLGTGLTGLSDAIKSFSWAFMGGWSLGTITGPLGKLADSVKKWKDISIPNTLTENLTSLADGIKAFSWAFVGGWSLSSITGPLGALAGSVKKWNGTKIPSALGKDLKSFAGGLKAIKDVGDMTKATSNLKSLASSAKTLSGVKFGTISTGLKSFASSLTTFASSGNSIAGVGSKIISNIISPLKKASSTLSGVGSELISSLANGITSKSGKATSAVKDIVTKMSNSINSKKNQFNTNGSKLAEALASGIKKSNPKVKSTVSSVMTSAVNKARSYYSKFESAGKYLVTGFANGISANTFKAKAKAAAMANAAYEAAKKALNINSPSKVFRALGYSVPEGFAMGIDRLSKMVVDSSLGMTDAAVNSVSGSIARIADIINNDVDAQPTIRPVLDLSEVSAGASRIGGMFDSRATVGVSANINAINSMMRNRQNGISDTDKLISAIRGIKTSGDTYNFDGITYDDGSNITDAVRTLVRAARVERRV